MAASGVESRGPEGDARAAGPGTTPGAVVDEASMRGSIWRRIWCWLPALAWMALIFWFSAQPDLPRPTSDLLNLIMRKTAHFGVYGVLALLYLYALGDWRRRWLALLLAALYAISDEYHQSWTPRRQPSALDVLIDSAGAATALWLAPRLWRWIGPKIAQRLPGVQSRTSAETTTTRHR